MDANAIQAAERLATERHYNYWEGTRTPNAMKDAEVLSAAYLTLVAKVRELRAAEMLEDFHDRLRDIYATAGATDGR